jgi:hypothetical protein
VSWTEQDGTQVHDILTLFWNNPILSSAKFNYHCTKLSVVVDFESKRHARVIFGIYKKGEAPTLESPEELRNILSMRQTLDSESDTVNGKKNEIDASNDDEYYSTHDDEDSIGGDKHPLTEVIEEETSDEKYYSANDEVKSGELLVNGKKVINSA